MDEREQMRQALEQLMYGLTHSQPAKVERLPGSDISGLEQACKATKNMYDGFLSVGFSEDQAFELTELFIQLSFEHKND